jgi:hypothetical protein
MVDQFANDEGKVWKKTIMDSLKVVSRNLPGGTEENTKTSGKLKFEPLTSRIRSIGANHYTATFALSSS